MYRQIGTPSGKVPWINYYYYFLGLARQEPDKDMQIEPIVVAGSNNNNNNNNYNNKKCHVDDYEVIFLDWVPRNARILNSIAKVHRLAERSRSPLNLEWGQRCNLELGVPQSQTRPHKMTRSASQEVIITDYISSEIYKVTFIIRSQSGWLIPKGSTVYNSQR